MAMVAVVIIATVPGAVSSFRTYQRNGVARRVLSEIRATQSQAVMRGAVFGLQWGADSGVNLPASQYRIVRDVNGACSFPSVSAPVDDTNVIRSWQDLSSEYAGVTIQSIRDKNNVAVGGVMFNPAGASVNTCDSVTFPVTVIVSDGSGNARSIEIRSAGGVRLL